MKPEDFEIGEGVCFGDYKSTEVQENLNKVVIENSEFICLNPLDAIEDHGFKAKSYYKRFNPRRADINVSELRNFLFEIDCIDLEDQLKVFEACKLPFYRITYSGGKSYHAVLALQKGLNLPVNTEEGISEYKKIWKRLQAFIDLRALEAGLEMPDGRTSFIDSSCKNPSRLTRFAGMFRNNGNLQEEKFLGSKINIDDFNSILAECPKIRDANEGSAVNFNVDTTEDFWKLCPIGLKNKLRYVDWAASENMYPELLKLTYWAIDSTGVDKDTFLEVLWDRTFKKLIEAGYPEDKLTIAIDHGYNEKRRC